MEILEAYDLTWSAWSAAELAGCDPKTVQRYVQLRDAGKDVLARSVRPKLMDQFADKIEELAERSHGKVRADVVHEKLIAMGFVGNERTTRRVVERAKTAYRLERGGVIGLGGRARALDAGGLGQGPRSEGAGDQPLLHLAGLELSAFTDLTPVASMELTPRRPDHRPSPARLWTGCDSVRRPPPQ